MVLLCSPKKWDQHNVHAQLPCTDTKRASMKEHRIHGWSVMVYIHLQSLILAFLPDRERSFQCVLGVGDNNVSFRKLISRLLPCSAELLRCNLLIQASLGICQGCRFTSVRVGQLPHGHLHGVPAQSTSTWFRGFKGDTWLFPDLANTRRKNSRPRAVSTKGWVSMSPSYKHRANMRQT